MGIEESGDGKSQGILEKKIKKLKTRCSLIVIIFKFTWQFQLNILFDKLWNDSNLSLYQGKCSQYQLKSI